jgi:hypothetical protein
MDSDLVCTMEQPPQTFQHLNSCRFAPFLKQHRWMRCTESNFVFAWYSRQRNNCVMITQFENLNVFILYTFLFIWTSVFCNKQKGASKQPSSLFWGIKTEHAQFVAEVDAQRLVRPQKDTVPTSSSRNIRTEGRRGGTREAISTRSLCETVKTEKRYKNNKRQKNNKQEEV